MSKRNRPTTAAQATHRRRRHAYRSALNAPADKATPAAGKGATAPKPAAAPKHVAAAPKPAAAAPSAPTPKPPQG